MTATKNYKFQPATHFIGKKIVGIRKITQEELEREGWDYDHGALVIELTGGYTIYASQDDEGNGPGALFAYGDGQAQRLGGWVEAK